MTKRYYSVEGEILGDSEAGDYMRDALGSVTGTCNPDTGSVWNTYRYKPYGGRLAKTGVDVDPRFQYIGTKGFKRSGLASAEYSIQGRIFDTSAALVASRTDLSHPDPNTAYAYEANSAFQVPLLTALNCKPIRWRTLVEPFFGLCGSWTTFEINFLLSSLPSTAKEGWIIQHVIQTWSISRHCESGAEPPVPDPPHRYWEAWFVRDRQKIFAFEPLQELNPNGTHDVSKRDNSYDCNTGTVAVDAYPKYCEMKKDELTSGYGFNATDRRSPWYRLHHSEKAPPGWTDTPSHKRFAFNKFDCCHPEWKWFRACPPLVVSINKCGPAPDYRPIVDYGVFK